jgi:Alpha/beta hydrolase of unknown function (DUF900)
MNQPVYVSKEFLNFLLSILILSPLVLHGNLAYVIATNTNRTNSSNIDALNKITSVYEINTRLEGDSHSSSNPVTKENQSYGYTLKNISELYSSCPDEIVIFVHGWNDTADQAKERLDRVKMSLEHNNYTNISLIGFSWPSDEDWPPAKQVAKENGPKLAQYIIKYMDMCGDNESGQRDGNKVRLIGHSLGSRVILSSLNSLDNDITWNDGTKNFTITSVDLMGAAVDDDEVSKNLSDVGPSEIKFPYGKAIELEVLHFYNLFSPNDDMLEPGDVRDSEYSCNNTMEGDPVIYPCFEQDLSLGQIGAQPNISKPERNYIDVNVENQILPIEDADGNGKCDLINFYSKDCMIAEDGDNHAAYMGFRSTDKNKPFVDDGAISVVVGYWRNETSR